MQNSIFVGDTGYILKKLLITPFLNPVCDDQNTYNEAQIERQNRWFNNQWFNFGLNQR